MSEDNLNEKVNTSKSMPWWGIVLIVVLFPIWFSIFCTAFALTLTAIIMLMVVVIVLWCVDLAFFALALGTLFATFVMLAKGAILSAVIYVGIALVASGLCMLAFLGCLALTKWIIAGTCLSVKGIVCRLSGKKEA